MKVILSLSAFMMIAGGLMGCSTTSNNANLPKTNTNTGYLSNNTNVSTPAPMTSSTPSASSSPATNAHPANNSGAKESVDKDAPANMRTNSNVKPKGNAGVNKNGN